MCLKGIAAIKNGVANNPEGPDIDFIAVANRSSVWILFDHFRSNVIGSTTDGVPFSFLLNFSSKSKISNLDFESLGKEQITELDITMNNIFAVQIFKPFGQLRYIESRLFFSKKLSSANEFIEGLIDAQLQKEVDVILGLEGFDETDNVLVVSLMGLREFFV